MEFLGVVDTVADNRKIIAIGTSNIPSPGNPVFDSVNKKVGTVTRVFGPINEPYIAVTVDSIVDEKALVGKELYTKRGTHNGKDKRRNRRD